MFFYLELEKDIVLHPKYFGPHLSERLMDKLYTEVEGTCSGEKGFIVAITSVNEDYKGKGRLMPGKGHVVYHVKYHAVVFRPVRGEVLDGTVTVVNKAGFFLEVGPMSVFVAVSNMPTEFSFDAASTPQCFKTSEAPIQLIKPGSKIRLKIIGLRIDAEGMNAIGTIKDDYLGVLES